MVLWSRGRWLFCQYGTQVQTDGRLWGLAVALAIIAGLASGYGQTNDTVSSLYYNRMQPTQSLASIGKLMADNRSQILLSLQHDPAGAYATLHDHPLDFHLKQIDTNITEVGAQWEIYKKGIRTDDHQKLADSFVEARQRYVKEGLLPARAALAEGRFDEANQILLKKINPTYTEAAQKANDLFKRQVERAQVDMEQSEQRFASMRFWVILIGALALAGGTFIALAIVRSVTRPIEDIIATFQSLPMVTSRATSIFREMMRWAKSCKVCSPCRYSRVLMSQRHAASPMKICASRLRWIAFQPTCVLPMTTVR
jgi:methyl-accepting chemotaxis protein